MHRTHTCGELTAKNIGETVTLSGWIQDKRDFGGLVFLALRDRYGVTQVSFNPAEQNNKNIEDVLSQLKNEYCVKLVGNVIARPEGQTNKNMKTGEIEIELETLEILNTCKELPFQMVNEPATSEENRFKHRYIDLRRRKVLENIQFRAKMNHFTRNWFTEQGFLEVQTPLFTVSSPEGARDFLIPSRVNPGKFYALPQAPQQYKQFLMIGGVDKYFQIAPCFRDEDPRADRHSCEFYQIDAEMSFVEQDDVFAVCEAYIKALIPTLVPHKKITVDFQRIPYLEAMERYGSDKPDIRFGMEHIEVTSIFAGGDIKFLAHQACIKTIKLAGQLPSRKEVGDFEKVVKGVGAGGLPRVSWTADGWKGSIAKLLTDENKQQLIEATDMKEGDSLFFGIGEKASVAKVLNKLRLHFRDVYKLVNDNDLAFVWVLDFPFYEMNEETEKLDFGHNPFSNVTGGLDALENNDPLSIMSEQYDMVLNGFEILSGSIRNHDPKILIKAFEKVGKGEEEIKQKFGAMYEAFQYGCPPHGGFAFGFDRLMMILLDEPNIRECYAFPKSGKAEDVMMGAPAEVDKELLDELHVERLEVEE